MTHPAGSNLSRPVFFWACSVGVRTVVHPIQSESFGNGLVSTPMEDF